MYLLIKVGTYIPTYNMAGRKDVIEQELHATADTYYDLS